MPRKLPASFPHEEKKTSWVSSLLLESPCRFQDVCFHPAGHVCPLKLALPQMITKTASFLAVNRGCGGMSSGDRQISLPPLFLFLQKEIPLKLCMPDLSITDVRPGLSLKKGHHCEGQIGVDLCTGPQIGARG